MNGELEEFYAALGYRKAVQDEMPSGVEFATLAGEPELAARGIAPAEPGVGERPPMSLEELDQLEQLFIEKPHVVMAWFRDAWDEDITEDDVWFALSEARMSFDSLPEATASMAARESFLFSAQRLPDDFTFEGIDLQKIEIDPGIRKFETKADVLGWLF